MTHTAKSAQVGGSSPASGDIEIEVITEKLDDKFATLPNVLHRAEVDDEFGFDYRGLTLRGRAMLAALLSMKSGYRCTRKRIDRLAPELKREAIDTVLWELRSKGYLRITRDNEATNGRFLWRWRAALRSRAEWAQEEKAERDQRRAVGKATATKPGVSAVQPMPGSSGHGSDTDNLDEPIPGSSGYGTEPDNTGEPIPGSAHVWGDPYMGSPVNGSPGVSKGEEPRLEKTTQDPENQEGEKTTPPIPPAPPPSSAPDVPQAAGGEGRFRFDEPTRAMLAAAVSDVLTHKPRWKPDEVRAAMMAEIDGGRTPAAVAAAVVDLARDPISNGPGRLKHAGSWWNGRTPANPRPLADVAPCRRHVGQLAHNCQPCLGEQNGADAPKPESEVDPKARDKAKAFVATLSSQRRRHSGSPAKLDQLIAATTGSGETT